MSWPSNINNRHDRVLEKMLEENIYKKHDGMCLIKLIIFNCDPNI